MRFFPLWVALFLPLAFGQSPASLPGCEPGPEVSQLLDEKLDGKELEKLKHTERVARSRQVLEDLIARYPRELEPHRRLIREIRSADPEHFPLIQERYRNQAAANPDDPLALFLAGTVLYRSNTPESIRLLEQALAKAPNFPWPALQLAEIYRRGKRADKEKASRYITAFFEECPDTADRTAHRFLGRAGAVELQAKVARALRRRLAKETDPKRLRDFNTLWGLEFRTRPPQEHEALRKQVAADVKRLESFNPEPDAEWLGFLKKGYQQSDPSAETLAAIDERILRQFPSSEEAFRITADRWFEENKEPEDHKDAAAWKQYNAASQAIKQAWIRQFTEVHWLPGSYFFNIFDEESLSEADGLAALEAYLRVVENQSPWPYNYLRAGEFLVNHKWQLERALALLRKVQTLLAEGKARRLEDDNFADEKLRDVEEFELYQQQSADGLILKAAELLGEPAEVRSLRASVEGPAPKQKKHESAYWLNRARLAALEERQADALAYYQSALHTRLEPPHHRQGRLRDDLTTEAKALWEELGGTESGWAVWSKPSAPQPQELAEGRWEKPPKELPAFQIADLSGHTWRLKTLEGKSLLINLWATWCGPCQHELPKLQKLYEKARERSDIEIITFNIDEDFGLVAPYVQKKGYTFPVLAAYNFVMGLRSDPSTLRLGIPQNWIVDPQGTWRWTQLGYDSAEPDWVGSMIKRLESVKVSEE